MDLREEIIVNIKFTYHVSLPDLDNGKCFYAGGYFKHHLHFFKQSLEQIWNYHDINNIIW